MGQVFSNLIGNALQYSPQDSVVHVNIAGQDNDVLISVHNDGDPIPAQKMKVVFESFTRWHHGEPAPGRAANLGLGLYIEKRIVLAHQGEISVSSTAKAGTAFVVRLPKR